MREIESTAKFKRDFKRETKSDSKVAPLIAEVLELLAHDRVLPVRLRDHPLAGDWKGFRDCHVKPDLVLIYKKVGDDLIKLVRLGSHSAIFWITPLQYPTPHPFPLAPHPPIQNPP